MLYENGKNIMNIGIERRLDGIPRIVSFINQAQSKYELRMKKYYNLNLIEKYNEYFTKLSEEIDEYKRDGLIFTEKNKSYDQTTCYNWKPVKHQTFDFLVMKPNEGILNNIEQLEGFTTYFLFCTVSTNMVKQLKLNILDGYSELFPDIDPMKSRNIPIQFSSMYFPLSYVFYCKKPDLHEKIVELRISANSISNGIYVNWRYVQTREDRMVIHNTYYGNFYKTIVGVFTNYIDPFPLEVLVKGYDDENYFASEKKDMYVAYTSYMSFFKETTMKEYLDKTKNVIDIGTGNGQDIFRYNRMKVKSLLAIDKDKTALTRLVNRWMDFFTKNTNSVEMNTILHTMVMDANDHYKENAEMVKCKFKKEYDVIVCNLAVHYFMESSVYMKNFVKLCSELIKKDGIVFLLYLNGEEVAKRLEGKEQYDLKENGVLKFSLKKLYSGDEVEGVGQKISVLLPFSGDKYYDEFLVNNRELESYFDKKEFDRVSHLYASDFVDEFRKNNLHKYELLSKEDKEYIKLFQVSVFKRR
jgi:hypothetical protein